MIDLVIQSPNQNLLYKPNRETHIIKGKTNTLGFYKKVIDEFNKKESVFIFPELGKEDIDIYNNKNKNPLSIYDEQAHKILLDIVDLIKKTCQQYGLSYKKNKYYLYSEIINNQSLDHWYDAGGTSKPNLFGIVSLDEIEARLAINKINVNLSPGEIILSEAGNRIDYFSKFKSLVFYVSPISSIKNQYSQKWIPLV